MRGEIEVIDYIYKLTHNWSNFKDSIGNDRLGIQFKASNEFYQYFSYSNNFTL